MNTATRSTLKPGMLAWVQVKHGYRYLGELISMPTPEDTIMVRRVPGDATTLDEVSLKDVQITKHSSRMFVHYARVAGMGSFPVDMLRYDAAAPVNFRIEEPNVAGPVRMVRTDNAHPLDGLYVAACTDRATPPWTYARWKSFVWSCVHIRTERLEGKR